MPAPQVLPLTGYIFEGALARHPRGLRNVREWSNQDLENLVSDLSYVWK